MQKVEQKKKNENDGNQTHQNNQYDLNNVNFDLADIYFPMYVIQINYDIFTLRNRNFKFQKKNGQNTNQTKEANNLQNPENQVITNDLAIYQHEIMKEDYENKCKHFFVLRDKYLLTKIQITGVCTYLIKKENKFFFGIDDSTGVLCCILWMNDYNAQIKQWLIDEKIDLGSTLSIVGALESYMDKIQLNVHKIRVIRDINEEMLQYQMLDQSQRCFFDPIQPFQRRIMNYEWQKDTTNKKKNFNENEQANSKVDDTKINEKKGEMVNMFSLKRIMKNLNNYILLHYIQLFQKDDLTEKKDSQIIIGLDQFLQNQILISKAKDELIFCEDRSATVQSLITSCLIELKEFGFINYLLDNKIEIIDQKQKLHSFILKTLESIQKDQNMEHSLTFDDIYKRVSAKFKNFYTKDIIYTAIDALYQQGDIIEKGNCRYALLNYQYN